MIPIHVLLFAAHREAMGTNHVDVLVPESSTAEQVFEALCQRQPKLAALRPWTSFAINREVADPSTRVFAGDELALLQPVSGG
ncbi:MAG TPA: MoaD/ThiS family protein [Chloroflexota bacterium]